MKPIILINFKTYKQASGKKALKLARACWKIRNKADFILCPQAADICPVAKKVKLKIFAQHVDPFMPERSTGFIIPEDIRQEGASGTLLNHSEHRIPFSIIKKTAARCEEAGLKAVICAASVSEAKKILALKPYCIMFEDPELVSTGKSITKIEPKSVKRFADAVNKYNKKHKTKIKALCGAGISSNEDAKLALKLGCNGIGIASAIVKAKNQEKKVLEIASF